MVGNLAVMFTSNLPLTYTDGTVTGYGWYIDAVNGYLGVFRMPGPVWEHLSAAGYCIGGVTYTLATNRRPSDGRFTTYVKGGVYTNWTLINSAMAGSNPSAADATYVTSAWMTLTLFAGDKILAHDPTVPGNPGHPRIYQGVLSPILGEVT